MIENSVLSNPNADRMIRIDERELENFENDASLIELASATIIKYQAPTMIKGVPIDWKVFEGVKSFTNALKLTVQSVRSAIKAMQSENKDDKVMHWGDAKNTAQKTADLLAKTNAKEVQNIAQQVFSLTQLYRNFENAAREGKRIESFPVAGIVELLQLLVMSI